jgi:hypothetical protein
VLAIDWSRGQRSPKKYAEIMDRAITKKKKLQLRRFSIRRPLAHYGDGGMMSSRGRTHRERPRGFGDDTKIEIPCEDL